MPTPNPASPFPQAAGEEPIPLAHAPFGEPPLLTERFVQEVLEAKQRDYDPRLAYALAVISTWAYSDRDTLSHKLHFYGFPRKIVQAFQVTNHALFVVATAYVVRSQRGRLAIIAFRGTEPINLASWLTDAEVITTRLKDTQGQVHGGFLANLEAVWDGIASELQRARRDAHPVEAIYITGHSLGGAMAVLAAAKLMGTEWASKLRGVYTFGQPAVGDQAFADWGREKFGDILFRHVYARDIVPRLPPASTGAFAHFGTEYHSRSAGSAGRNSPELPPEIWAKRSPGKETTLLRFALPSAAGALLEFATRRTQWLRRLRFTSSIDDHGPAFYLKTSRDHAHASRSPGTET